MKTLICSILALLTISGSVCADSSTEGRTYHFEKGAIVDFLFAIQRPDADEALGKYFEEAIPVAMKLGYQPLSSLKVSGSATRGNFRPDYVAMGAWKNGEIRESALASIEENVSGFHQRRRDIWSAFNMALFEIKDDVSFVLSPKKTYAFTNYWKTDDPGFERARQEWRRQVEKAGGVVKIVLEDATSPSGYPYAPDLMVLTEWNSPADFAAFDRANGAKTAAGIDHVDEFLVVVPPPRK